MTLKLLDILRAQNIKRWVIVNTSRNQSLAEHTFNVIAITRELCSKLNIDDSDAIKYAFDHDLDEILTGDIPTPAKERLGISTDNVYNGKSKEKCDPIVVNLVSVADIMEAIIFISENGVGRHSAEVHDYLRQKLSNKLETIVASTDDPRMLKLIIVVGEIFDDLTSGDFIL